MSKIRFYFDNWIDPDALIGSTASSEASGFPASNAYNFLRRGKVWRTAGARDVIDTENTIVVQETIGSVLTATVIPGHYASSALFYAAIKSALEAAGDSTYTVSGSTSGHVVILSGLTGGGGVFRPQFQTSTAMADVMGFAHTAHTGAASYTAELLVLHTSEWLRWDLGLSSNPRAFALMGPANQPLQISSTATIKLEGNETDTWTGPSYSATLTHDERGIYLENSAGFHTEGLRYWRLKIQDEDNPNGYVQIGVVFLGDYWEPTTAGCQFPWVEEQVEYSDVSQSESGADFVDVRDATISFKFSIDFLTLSEKEALEAIYQRFRLSEPLFVSADPDATFGDAAVRHVKLVKFDNAVSFSFDFPQYWSAGLSLREVL